MGDELEKHLHELHSLTSLEELLDWDYDLVEYLIGAWGMVSIHQDSIYGKDACVTLLAAQLPLDKQEKYQNKLEKWIHDNYNMIVR
tara:strand:- start:429 stop:686 length:258 start_codon:yes stop_codon:yes gene_type:complete